MKYVVGQVAMNLGKASDMNLCPPKHESLKGYNQKFSDFEDHICKCVDIKEERIYMKCSCGGEWSFPEAPDLIHEPEGYGLLDFDGFKTVKNIPIGDFRKLINKDF